MVCVCEGGGDEGMDGHVSLTCATRIIEGDGGMFGSIIMLPSSGFSSSGASDEPSGCMEVVGG